MAKVKLLIDSDVFIDYFNAGFLSDIFDNTNFMIHYSSVTKKELLSKRGLRESAKQAILLTLKKYRGIKLNNRIMEIYSNLRIKHKRMEKEDALIAATALAWNLPLLTRNWKHYSQVENLILFRGILS